MVLHLNECQPVAWEQVNSKSHNLGAKTIQWQNKTEFLVQIRLPETGDWRPLLQGLRQSGFPLMKCPSASQRRLTLPHLSLQILSASYLRTKLSSAEMKQTHGDRQMTNSAVDITFPRKKTKTKKQLASTLRSIQFCSSLITPNGLLLRLRMPH